MEINNLVKNAYYFDFINNLDNLVFNLLYSDNSGYILKSSKDAIENVQEIISKYDYEASKLEKNCNFEQMESAIKEKKKELIFEIQKHYQKQLKIWIDEIYKTAHDNCLLAISVNKNNPFLINKNCKKLFDTLNFLFELEKPTEKEKTLILNKLKNEINFAINSKETDYLEKNPALKTKADYFLKLQNLIVENEEEFLKLDLRQFQQELSIKDLNYFQRIKNELQTCKNTKIKDEIRLIQCAINILNLKTDEEKYEFIKNVNNDFENNKKDQNDTSKIEIVKRRMELCQNGLKYYKNKLIS